MLDSFSNAYITYKIVTNNTFYICICVKKLSKIKIDKSNISSTMSQEIEKD